MLIHLPKQSFRMWAVCMGVISNTTKAKPKPNHSELEEAERMIAKARQIAKQTRSHHRLRKLPPNRTTVSTAPIPLESKRGSTESGEQLTVSNKVDSENQESLHRRWRKNVQTPGSFCLDTP